MSRFKRFVCLETLPVLAISFMLSAPAMSQASLETVQVTQLARRFNQDVPKKAAWQWDMIWDDGAMFKGGYSGQGIFVDPGRDIVAVWYGTSGTDGENHQLLPLTRKLSKVCDVNRSGQQIVEWDKSV